MHGTEHRVPERRALRLSAPRKPVYPASASSLPSAPQPLILSKTGPFARNGLSLTREGLRLREFRPGVEGPGLPLRSLACRSSCPFGFSAPPPVAGSPQRPAASTPQARCIPYRPALPAVLPACAPLWEFSLPWDQRTGKLRNRSVRLPELPDLVRSPQPFHLKIRLRINVTDPLPVFRPYTQIRRQRFARQFRTTQASTKFSPGFTMSEHFTIFRVSTEVFISSITL